MPFTSTADDCQADLAAAIDEGNGAICIDSIPSQRIHVISPPHISNSAALRLFNRAHKTLGVV